MGVLDGRVALVTGASSGIGATLALGFSGAGARLVLLARRQDRLEKLARKLDAHPLPCDLADRDALLRAAEDAAEPYGPPDIVVHAAGLNPRQHALDLSTDDWDRTLAVNLTAPFLLTRALVPAMLGKGWGRILNIASLQSRRAFARGMPYGASQGCLAQLTRAMAREWGRGGVTCNAIAPGFFPTPLTRSLTEDEEAWQALADQTCVGRNGRLIDLVGPALFLCSDSAAFVTGQVLYVDGGFSAR